MCSNTRYLFQRLQILIVFRMRAQFYKIMEAALNEHFCSGTRAFRCRDLSNVWLDIYLVSCTNTVKIIPWENFPHSLTFLRKLPSTINLIRSFRRTGIPSIFKPFLNTKYVLRFYFQSNFAFNRERTPFSKSITEVMLKRSWQYFPISA